MRILFFSFLALAFAATAVAAPEFNQAEWNRLVKKTSESPDCVPFDTSEACYLTHLQPEDKTVPHLAEYFTAFGTRTPEGFFPYQISLVIEDWRKTPEGNWDIDQWIYETAVDGMLYNLMHFHMVQTPDHRVLESKRLPAGTPSDPAEQERWLGFLSRWYGR